MQNADPANQALPSVQPAEASGKPEQRPTAQQPLGLLQEIIARAQSGENPARLRELRMKRLQRIDAQLALGPQPDLPKLHELRAILLAVMQPIQQAIHRTDLTVPELLLLNKMSQRTDDQIRKSLIAEKEMMEQMRAPGARRHDRSS